MSQTPASIFRTVLATDVSDSFALDGVNADEQDLLANMLPQIRKFGEQHIDGTAIESRGRLGDELLSQTADRGLFGLTIPEDFGGVGLSMKSAARVVSELGLYDASLAVCVGLHSGLGLYSLLKLGSEMQHQKYLPEIAEGKRIVSFCATEPQAGSDIGSMRSTLCEGKNGLELTGGKCWVTNGGIANLLTVVARSPGMGGAKIGHTMMLVDPAWSGVSRQNEEKKLGLKGSSTISIDFENVAIPRDHILGEPSEGLQYAHRALTWGRTFMAAGCLGPARTAMRIALEYVENRAQFGRTLTSFPLVRAQLAGAQADIYIAETVVRLACDLDTRHQDISLVSLAAKVFASELAWDSIDRAIQLMGGTGYMEESGVARRLRDVRVTRIFEGANDVLRLHLALSALNWPRAELEKCPELSTPQHTEIFRHAFDRATSSLLTLRKKYGFRFFEQQTLQSHLADVILCAVGILAILLRTESESKILGSNGLSTLAELAIDRLSARLDHARSLLDCEATCRRQILADAIFESMRK